MSGCHGSRYIAKAPGLYKQKLFYYLQLTTQDYELKKKTQNFIFDETKK